MDYIVRFGIERQFGKLPPISMMDEVGLKKRKEMIGKKTDKLVAQLKKAFPDVTVRGVARTLMICTVYISDEDHEAIGKAIAVKFNCQVFPDRPIKLR